MKPHRLLLVLAAALVLAGLLVWRAGREEVAPESARLPRPGREGASAPVLRGSASDARADERQGRGVEARGGDVYAGLVYDTDTSRPLPGVTVTFRGVEETSEATTDERGVFRLVVTQGSSWYERLHFAKEGYVPTARQGLLWSVAGERLLEPVGLDPVLARLPGRVVDWRGRPLGGVTVRIEDGEPTWVTASDGSFGPVAVGGYDVDWVAWGPDCARTSDSVDLRPVVPDVLVLRMLPHDAIPGRVVDEDGEGVATAQVCEAGRYDELMLTTARDGSFHWPAPLDRYVRLVAVKGDRAGWVAAECPLPTRIVLHEIETGTWRDVFHPVHAPSPPPSAKLARLSFVRARILPVDESGDPIPLAQVEVRCRGLPFDKRIRTGPEGGCELDVPAEIELEIGAERVGLLEEQIRTSFTIDGPHEVRLVLPPRVPEPHGVWTVEEDERNVWMTGLVLTAKGCPRPDVEVHAWPCRDSSDDWGRFTIFGRPTSPRVDLWVTGDDFPPFSVPVVPGGSDVIVRLPARGALRIRPSRAGEEDAGPQVRLWRPPCFEDAMLENVGGEYVLADGDGYRIDCAVGTYDVAFRLEPGAWALYRDVRVVAGKETRLAYDLPRCGRLEAWVRDETGAPVEDAEVSVADTGGFLGTTDEHGHLSTAIDDDYRDRVVPAGVAILRVDAEGRPPVWTRPLDLRGDVAIDVTLEHGVQVGGVVRDASDRPVHPALVGWRAGRSPILYESQTNEDGRFELYGSLPPGEARLVVQVEGRAPFETRIEVPDDRPSWEVVLRLP